MTVESSLTELRAWLQLQSSETLILAVAEDDARVEATRDVMVAFLRAEAMAVVDLGASASDEGPLRWVEKMQAAPPQAPGILTFVPATSLAGGAFARRLNAEREWLRRLAAPVVLVVSRAMERILRRHAPDFFTWIARTYDLSPFDELRPLAREDARPRAASPVVEPPVRFLHLSDLHLRPQRIRRYDQDHVLRGLLEFLERDRAAFPLDLIFVTGDLAYAGKPEEYALVGELLVRLAEVTGVPPARTFVVPGNHDVDREVGRWLLRTLPSREEATAFFVEPGHRRFHAEKFAAYRLALGPMLGPARPLGLAVGAEAVEVVEVRGVRIAVASFNSAWFAQGDDDREKLWVGGPSVERAADAVAAGEARFAVALLHHPFEQLHELDREEVEPWFDRSFDLVLRGHLHRSRTQSIATQRGGFVEVAAPAAYQGSPWPSGCFLGEIRAGARTVRLRPYAYAAGPDPWVIDPKVFPDDAAEGHCRTFTVPEKRRARGAAAMLWRAVAESAVRNASAEQVEAIAQRVAPEAKKSSLEQTVASVRSIADTPELWSDVLGSAADPRIDGALEAVVAREGIAEKLVIDGVDALARALTLAGEVYWVSRMDRARHLRLKEQDDTLILAAALERLIEPPLAIEAVLAGGTRLLRPDIVIHQTSASPVAAIVEVKRLRGHAASNAMLEAGLRRLDGYLDALPGGCGALVFVGAPPQDEGRPRVGFGRSPAGRRVALMEL